VAKAVAAADSPACPGGAGPARATVRALNAVHSAAHSAALNAAHNGAHNAAGHGAGHGLIGMRERVARCGGEIDTGPLADGGYRVTVALPLA
jgi:glucose-6-phosphate-specific signal transduction histidine kinase